MKFSTSIILLGAIAAPLAALAAATDEVLYMWTDAEGVTTFSQTMPRDQDATEIEKPMLPGPATAPPPPETQEVIALNRENAATIERNCAIGRRTLENLTAHKNIYMIADDGFFRLISDEQRTEEVAKAQGIVREWCGEPER